MAAKGIVDPCKLPPTASVAKLHNLRSIYQAIIWEVLDTNHLDPCQYGWTVLNDIFSPTPISDACAPDDLLKLIRCKCKSGCQSANCSCKKHGLSCAVACQNCRGCCENSEVKITIPNLIIN